MKVIYEGEPPGLEAESHRTVSRDVLETCHGETSKPGPPAVGPPPGRAGRAPKRHTSGLQASRPWGRRRAGRRVPGDARSRAALAHGRRFGERTPCCCALPCCRGRADCRRGLCRWGWLGRAAPRRWACNRQSSSGLPAPHRWACTPLRLCTRTHCTCPVWACAAAPRTRACRVAEWVEQMLCRGAIAALPIPPPKHTALLAPRARAACGLIHSPSPLAGGSLRGGRCSQV